MIAPSLLPTSNPISIPLIQITSIRRAYKNLFSKIIHAINNLESLNRKINNHNALAIQKTNQKPRINSSLQMETKDTSLGAHFHDGQSLELLYPASENLPKAFSKVRFGGC